NEGQLSLGSLDLIANDNAAEINLNLIVESLNVYNPHAWPILQLSGSSKYCQINIEGDAKINLRNFTVENEFKFASESSQLGEINIQNANKFIGQLKGNGDVHYYGESVEFYKSEIGKGRFIKK
ncbi:MAG: GIN domain-containing protein, partial [Crocinitomicaceae bacterium]